MDKLLNDETEDEDLDIDFTRMLGPTVDGEWQMEEVVKEEEKDEEEVGLKLLTVSQVSKAVSE